jgi:hypothetical protein
VDVDVDVDGSVLGSGSGSVADQASNVPTAALGVATRLAMAAARARPERAF